MGSITSNYAANVTFFNLIIGYTIASMLVVLWQRVLDNFCTTQLKLNLNSTGVCFVVAMLITFCLFAYSFIVGNIVEDIEDAAVMNSMNNARMFMKMARTEPSADLFSNEFTEDKTMAL